MDLVTGGAGFLGAALCRELVQRGHRVRVLDDLSRGDPRRLAGLAVELVTGDVRDAALVRQAAAGCSTLWHLAMINGTRHFYERPDEVLEVGLRGTLNACDAATAAGVRRLVFVSSSEVYATPPTTPTPESVPLVVPDLQNPRFSYGGAKLAGELLTVHLAGRRGVQGVVVRPHNVYGPDMGEDHVIPQFLARLLEQRRDGVHPCRLEVEGDGEQTRSFCYIDDAARGLCLAGLQGEPGTVYHLGNEEMVTINELVTRLGALLGVSIAVTRRPLPRGSTCRRQPDVGRLRALGYSPQVTLDAGLRRTVAWHLERAGLAR